MLIKFSRKGHWVVRIFNLPSLLFCNVPSCAFFAALFVVLAVIMCKNSS